MQTAGSHRRGAQEQGCGNSAKAAGGNLCLACAEASFKVQPWRFSAFQQKERCCSLQWAPAWSSTISRILLQGPGKEAGWVEGNLPVQLVHGRQTRGKRRSSITSSQGQMAMCGTWGVLYSRFQVCTHSLLHPVTEETKHFLPLDMGFKLGEEGGRRPVR